MNLKQTIILDLASNREFFGQFTNPETAMPAFLERNADAKAIWDKDKVGYFKYFFNKIYVENVLENPEHAISKDLAKYKAKSVQNTRLMLQVVGQSDSVVGVSVPTYAPPAVANEIEIITFSTANVVQDAAMFKCYLTNSPFDDIHSEEGGAMAACSVIVVGGPGVGKTTLLFWAASKYREIHPEAKIAVVSSEMEKEDLLYEARRKPWMNALDFILTSDHTQSLERVLEKIFLSGYDIIILDSFADIVDKLRDFCGMTTTRAENWMLDLMKKAKGARNDEKKFTLTFAIQQQTKSGSFAGTNKLKHNTTAMLELRREKNGDRYMVYTKNRRCGKYVGKRLFYFLGQNNHVTFDLERWEREISDEVETPTNQQQENLDQVALSQFDQLDGTAQTRLASLMEQAEIRMDADGNPIIPTIPGAPAPAAVEVEIMPGRTMSDITYDDTTELYILEVSPTEIIQGASIQEVLNQIPREEEVIADDEVVAN